MILEHSLYESNLITGQNAGATKSIPTAGTHLGTAVEGRYIEITSGALQVGYQDNWVDVVTGPANVRLFGSNNLMYRMKTGGAGSSGPIENRPSQATAVPTSLVLIPRDANVVVNNPIGYSVEIRDQFGHLMPTATNKVTFTASGAAGTWSTPGEVTPVNGIAQNTFTPTGTEATTIFAAATGLNGDNTSLVITAVPVATTIELVPSGATPIIGEEVDYTATIRDQFGQIFLTSGVVTFGNSGVAGSWNNATPNAINGVADAAFTPSASGSGNITADFSTLGQASVPITVQIAPPVATYLTIEPASASVEVNTPIQYTARVFDQYDNPYTIGAIPITFAHTTITGTWQTNPSNTSAGVALNTFTPTTTEAGIIAVSASGLTGASTPITATPPEQAAYELRFNADTSIAIPAAVALAADEDYTIEIEFKRISSSGRRDIWSANAGENYLQCRLAEPTNRMRSDRSTGGKNWAATLWTPDVWHKWVERWVTADERLFVELDGDQPDNWQFLGSAAMSSFIIGAGGAGENFIGYIREFIIRNAAGVIIHRWKIDDNSATIVDSVGGQNGTLTIGTGAWEATTTPPPESGIFAFNAASDEQQATGTVAYRIRVVPHSPPGKSWDSTPGSADYDLAFIEKPVGFGWSATNNRYEWDLSDATQFPTLAGLSGAHDIGLTSRNIFNVESPFTARNNFILGS